MKLFKLMNELEEGQDLGGAAEEADTESTEVAEESGEELSLLDELKQELSGGEKVESETEKKPDTQEEQKPAEDDYTEPAGLTKEASERFQKLVAGNKEKDSIIAERESIINQQQAEMLEFRQLIDDHIPSTETFVHALDFCKLLKSGDLESAYAMVEEERIKLAKILGKPLHDVDTLADHPDLRAAVDNGEITEQAAAELLRGRELQAALAAQRQQQEDMQHRNNQNIQTKNQALSAIDKMAMEWSKSDPSYSKKEAIILENIQSIAANFHPTQWVTQVQLMYNALSKLPIQTEKPKTPTPLRATGAMAGNREPATLKEELMQKLNYV